MEVKVDKREVEKIVKDPDKLRGLAKDLRAEAERLDARAANPKYVSKEGDVKCAVAACLIMAT